MMVITLGPDLESALTDLAHKQGVAPEVLVVNALRERFLAPAQRLQPRDEWERRLLGAATDYGAALFHEAVSSDGLYEQWFIPTIQDDGRSAPRYNVRGGIRC